MIILFLTGLFTLSTCVNHQYHFVNVTKNWTEAQTHCKEHYTDLATIENQEDTDELIKTVKGDVERVWIGLEKSGDERWQWSLGDPAFYREGEMEFTNWDEDAPKDGSSSEDCVVIRGNGKWKNKACTEMKPFVCYDDKPILINMNLTWSEALNCCRGHRMDLVSVHSEKIQKWVMKRVEKASTDHVWLGLRYSCSLGFWFWVSGESSCYQNWAPGNGTVLEECVNEGRTGAVETRGDKKWISLPENNRLNFICSNYEGGEEGPEAGWQVNAQSLGGPPGQIHQILKTSGQLMGGSLVLDGLRQAAKKSILLGLCIQGKVVGQSLKTRDHCKRRDLQVPGLPLAQRQLDLLAMLVRVAEKGSLDWFMAANWLSCLPNSSPFERELLAAGGLRGSAESILVSLFYQDKLLGSDADRQIIDPQEF
ncbi:secretory phospholipase A2 receptor-like [Chanos chanos]|uniref:Secretory phospholipase A2 receptor-like n=1 Tax=Chanos chanos TaxID=29144 RepID=A0A6J2VQL5_CHACN|nr:secretory phospholipase A2 receptor-like [Chanos chanos]